MARPSGFFRDFDVFYDSVRDDMDSGDGGAGGANGAAASAGIGAGIGALFGGPIGAALGAGIAGAGAWMLAKTWSQDEDMEAPLREKYRRKYLALLRKRENGEFSPKQHRKAVKELAEDLEVELF